MQNAAITNKKLSKPGHPAGHSQFIVQPKLEINTPGDRYEQEADAMADKVMRMSEQSPPSFGMIAPSVQRKCSHCEQEEKRKKKEMPLMRKTAGGEGGFEASPGLVSKINSSKGGGSLLPGTTRSFMENAFSADFSKVRVHTDNNAAEMNRGIHAKAFTHESDIYFNSFQYDSSSREGQLLLAHELTHVVQQNKNLSTKIIQRACGFAEIGTHKGCNSPNNTPVETPRYLFNPSCDTLIPDDELQLIEDTKTYFDGETVEIHGLAGNEGDPIFNMNLSCARAKTAQIILQEAEEKNGIRLNMVLYAHGALRGEDLVDNHSVTIVRYTSHNIQSTTIGQILDEFFAPDSIERLWLMSKEDNYTAIVRKWQPVIDALNVMLQDIAGNCWMGSLIHKTSSLWRPGFTDPPGHDAKAYRKWVNKPPGTDPLTCMNAFSIYRESQTQTNDLYTCSIGSFGLYVTIDSIDYSENTANLDVWMYNAMDQESFGHFAYLFPRSGMERQYMWWNWNEIISCLDFEKIDPGGFSKIIKFDTDSDLPNEEDMENLKIHFFGYDVVLSHGNFLIIINGYASLLGDLVYNQTLSDRRAKAVKAQLELIIGKMLSIPRYEFHTQNITINPFGEEEASNDTTKSDDDDSQSDRIVEVVFEVR